MSCLDKKKKKRQFEIKILNHYFSIPLHFPTSYAHPLRVERKLLFLYKGGICCYWWDTSLSDKHKWSLEEENFLQERMQKWLQELCALLALKFSHIGHSCAVKLFTRNLCSSLFLLYFRFSFFNSLKFIKKMHHGWIWTKKWIGSLGWAWLLDKSLLVLQRSSSEPGSRLSAVVLKPPAGPKTSCKP